MSLFLVVIIGITWAFSYVYQSPGILYVGVIFSVGMNIISYWYSDKIVIKMSGAKPATRAEYFDLWNTVENLSITAGLPMPSVYIISDDSPNAFATGRNKEHAVVAVTTGLLKILTKTELEGVIAHELSHIGNRDILLSTVVVVLVGFVVIISDMFLRTSLFRGGSRDREDNGGGFMIILGIIFAILSPLIVKLIQLAISRKREFLADASGALLTRYPEGLANALEKISASPVPLQHKSNAMAHLYIANPVKNGHSPSFFSKIFSTHPPVEERVRALRGIGDQSISLS
ncbi:MAG: M48 family metallopeptidase [Candidatus Yonathbacteria bacterium]|nr:M48 family metallopeptidase [Candidatus Yonathbacteria bacterium]